jgi:AraC-like DNA-binding protein
MRKNGEELLLRRDGQYLFPLHFHLDLEVVLVRKGSVRVAVNGQEYTVSDGELLVVDSYDVHGYGSNEETGDHCVIVLPNRYLSLWNAIRKDLALKTPLVQNKSLVDELLLLTDTYLGAPMSEITRSSALQLFLSRLSEGVEFVESKGGNERTLARNILVFLQENYRGDASLKRVARELGYAQEHISRTFHRFVKKSISAYVNELRLDYIEALRRQGEDRSNAELAFEAGFNSLQTYYRALSARRKENSVGE